MSEVQTPVTGDFFHELDEIQTRVDDLCRLVRIFESDINSPPVMLHSQRRFYFSNPDYRHFCLLKSTRIASGFNAMLVLAKTGYAQEIFVLLRGVLEAISFVEWAMLTRGEVEAREKADKTIAAYFADTHREVGSLQSSGRIKQEDIHAEIGRQLDAVSGEDGKKARNGRQSKDLMWNIYAAISNYVHARYPETVDMYGGNPGFFPY